MGATVREQLLQALKKIDRPASFCMQGRLPGVLPGLEIAKVGPVSLPLTRAQAEILKKHARQAPYGKGTETLVDTNVRKVWEIAAEKVELTNPDWSNVVAEAVAATQKELGLEEQKLQATLYDLLLYEKGSFFLPHRDGEKLDRMVATLVIALPSEHSGGELVVRHEGREVVVDFAPDSRFHTQFAAFYADCEHEVRPVKRGHRLALVYNLTLAKGKRGITAPTSSVHITAVRQVLEQWPWTAASANATDAIEPDDVELDDEAEFDDAEDSEVALTAKGTPSGTKLAVLLDHQYTEAGLVRDALKGTDRAKADVLFAAAEAVGYDASLALVTYWVTGSAEPGDWEYRRGRRRHGYYDKEDAEAGEHEMGEVYDRSRTAQHFSDAHGRRLSFGEIPLREAEIISAEPMEKRPPDKEDFEGYTGNEGMTLERWYHRAAVVLWPTATRLDVLCDAGVETAVGGLALAVRDWTKARKADQPAQRQHCIDFARRIIARWPERKDTWYAPSADPKRTDFLPLLAKLDDPALLREWIARVPLRDSAIDPGSTLGDLCQLHGWGEFHSALRTLFQQTSRATLERNARLLADFAARRQKSPDRDAVCRDLAAEIETAVERLIPGPRANVWERRPVDLPALLASFVQALLGLKATDAFKKLVTYVLAHPQDFDLTTVQVPALLTLAPWLKRTLKQPFAPLQTWLTAVDQELTCRASRPPTPPATWERPADFRCDCADCRALKHFLQDPETQTIRRPLAKDRRQHQHNIIDGNKLDTTHETERKGSPYILVCTKTRGSYERAVAAHKIDVKQHAQIQPLVKWHASLATRRPHPGASGSP